MPVFIGNLVPGGNGVRGRGTDIDEARRVSECASESIEPARGTIMKRLSRRRVEPCPRRESNPHLRFRKPSFYPLNYGDVVLRHSWPNAANFNSGRLINLPLPPTASEFFHEDNCSQLSEVDRVRTRSEWTCYSDAAVGSETIVGQLRVAADSVESEGFPTI